MRSPVRETGSGSHCGGRERQIEQRAGRGKLGLTGQDDWDLVWGGGETGLRLGQQVQKGRRGSWEWDEKPEKRRLGLGRQEAKSREETRQGQIGEDRAEGTSLGKWAEESVPTKIHTSHSLQRNTRFLSLTILLLTANICENL